MNVELEYLEHERKVQRDGLFRTISSNFFIQCALYPDSSIDISPSFYFPRVVYLDIEDRSKEFFTSSNIRRLIEEKSKYKHYNEFRYHQVDYRKELPEREESFDLLISLNGRFVSQECKRYLQKRGILVVDNSSSDAGLAYMDPDFTLMGIINHTSGMYTFSNEGLPAYFIPSQSPVKVTKEYLLTLDAGIEYEKVASYYIFQKNENQ